MYDRTRRIVTNRVTDGWGIVALTRFTIIHIFFITFENELPVKRVIVGFFYRFCTDVDGDTRASHVFSCTARIPPFGRFLLLRKLKAAPRTFAVPEF